MSCISDDFKLCNMSIIVMNESEPALDIAPE